MPDTNAERFPDELEGIAARLSEQSDPDPLKLDRIKQRALAQSMSGNGRHASMRSWLTAALTGLVLVVGSGGALALSRLDSHPNTQGGAADVQYKPGKGCGDKNHPRPPGQCKPKP